MSLYSCDGGMTWSNITKIEETDKLRPSCYGTPVKSLAVPGRVYVIYNYNHQGITTLPSGQKLGRNDLVGDGFSLKWTDDMGKSWSSERLTVNLRNMAIDR